MRLSEDWSAAYSRHLAEIRGTDWRKELEALTDGVEAGDVQLENVFIDADQLAHCVRGAVRLISIEPATLVLTEWQGGADPSCDALSQLIGEARARAEALGATRVMTRINAARFSEAYRRALGEAGFRRQGRRVEYRMPVSALPPEGPSELRWRTMREAAKPAVAETLYAVAGDGPDALNVSDGRDVIARLLHGPYADADPRSVQLGTLGGLGVCVLFVRVDADSGWATVAYMGVRPEFRRRGIGAQAHRHGFAVIRALGGVLYHDGTSSENQAMIRLFETHGCIEHERMEEWVWRTAG